MHRKFIRPTQSFWGLHRMPFRITWLLILVTCAMTFAAGEPRAVRELYIPAEDLERVLEAAGDRVFLTRQEYDALRQQAQQSPDEPAPESRTVVRADYEATVAEGRASFVGTLVIQIGADGLQAVPLDLGHVGVKRATLDGQPAAIGSLDGCTTLFVSGRGRHELILEMMLPVEVTAARQTLRYRLPVATTGRMRLTVPGDVEVRSGAAVRQRVVDAAAGVTRFELLPPQGETALELTLNNRLSQRQQVIVARQVIVDELTETYERLHATISLRVLHGSAEQFRLAIPADFEVTQIATPQMARWEMNSSDGQNVVVIQLRGPTTGTEVLQLTAERTTPPLTGWQMPQLQPLDVASCVSAFGLLAEDRLRLQSLTPQGLIPIDTQTLTDRLPASVLTAEPGAPRVRPLAAYYAPNPTYALTADLEKPRAETSVTSNLLLVIQDAGLEVLGGFALIPAEERIFECQLTVQPDWEVTEVTHDGQPLHFDQFEQSGQPTRIRVVLPQGVTPGDTFSLNFRAVNTPSGWLDTWSSQSLSFPQFAIADATTDRGAVAVQVRDDLTARPEAAQNLTPLDDRNKAQFNLSDVPTALAYRYESRPFELTLQVDRKPSRITAETYSFLKIEPGNLQAHYEIFYRVLEARTRELTFALPQGTPAELTLEGLDGVAVKESSSRDVEDGRLREWTVQLVKPAEGSVHLSARFQQRLDFSQSTEIDRGTQLLDKFELPLIQATNVEYQSGMVAVEGSDELEIGLTTDARKIDIGELVDAGYRPGRRLLGSFGFVGDPAPVAVRVVRPEGYRVPEAVIERSELLTIVSSEKVSQTAARFHLRTKAQFVEVALPSGSTIWSVVLDDKPSKPQHVDQRLLVSLPPTSEATLRNLQLVYETPIAALGMRGSIELEGPRLWLRDRDGSPALEVPVADLTWHVQIPAGYYLADSRGTVFPNLDDDATRRQLAARPSAWQQVAATVVGTPGPLILAQRAEAVAYQSAGRAFRGRASSVEHFAAPTSEPALVAGDAEIRDEGLSTLDFAESDAPAEAAGVQSESAVEETQSLDAFQPLTQPAGPPQQPAPPRTEKPPGPSETQRGTFWALEGLRSLKIDLTQMDQALEFQSLGSDPVLDIRLIDQRRIRLLSWTVGLGVVLIGLVLLHQSAARRWRFLVGVLLAATVGPMFLGGYRPWGAVFDFALYAALILFGIYLLTFLWQRLVNALRPWFLPTTTALLWIALLPGWADAQPSAAPAVVTADGPLPVQLVDPVPPVQVPPDAILIPYDAQAAAGGVPQVERILVPYNQYVELWNRAHPEERLTTDPPPAEFSFAGGQWRARLEDDGFLRVEGQLLLDLFVDQPVAVPLDLGGGVLEQATQDGQPARIQLLQALAPQGGSCRNPTGCFRTRGRVASVGRSISCRGNNTFTVNGARGTADAQPAAGSRLNAGRIGYPVCFRERTQADFVDDSVSVATRWGLARRVGAIAGTRRQCAVTHSTRARNRDPPDRRHRPSLL